MERRIDFFRAWKVVRCKKNDGREFLALHQSNIGDSHIVWDGEQQYLIKKERGDSMVDATEQETIEIYDKLDKQFNSMFGKIESQPHKKEESKLIPKLKVEYEEVVEVKEMTDFELVTADIGTI
jgi:hypothetical protein